MSGGISKNPLTDISQLYLDTVAKVKDAEVKQDIERWGQTQKESQDPTANKPKAPQFNAAKELVQKAPYMKPALQQRNEGFSSWRGEMREVIDQDVAAFCNAVTSFLTTFFSSLTFTSISFPPNSSTASERVGLITTLFFTFFSLTSFSAFFSVSG